ncbi:MAG: PepSY domain-containing protein [Gammaproteobacteria bacterium]|nr:PepSY domain-containing protein [Gammaproteobacteria bacterium]
MTPLSALWKHDQLEKIAAPYKDATPLLDYVSSDVVLASVLAQVPNADISFISWLGSPYATPHHYTVALRGNTPLTERLLQLAMVDAKTGRVTNIEETPWYMNAMFLSVPLHFGDYGGLPLKIIWALFDLAAIIVLYSGFYLWLKKHYKLGKNNKVSLKDRSMAEGS